MAGSKFRLASKRFRDFATAPRPIAALQQRWRDFRIAQVKRQARRSLLPK
jgi:hypothetical protein